MKFRYVVELKKGYTPVLRDTEETWFSFEVTARNRVTADRMIKAMLQGAPNVEGYSGICINDD